MSPTEILKSDHEAVKTLFAEYQGADDDETRQHIAERVSIELEVHARIEEKLLYPVLRTLLPDGTNLVEESQKEHENVKMLLDELRELTPAEPEFRETFDQLMAEVKHHIGEEEKKLFPQAEEHLSKEEQHRMAEEITELKHQLSVTAQDRA